MTHTTRVITVDGQDWNVLTSGPEKASRTLMICNGIGACVETLEPLLEHFPDTRVIGFDVPGVGDSPSPLVPYRLSNMTQMLDQILAELEIERVDVMGVSWGGALAQQFARDFPERCETLILAATTAGFVMVPGNISVLSKMATPRRYLDPEYMMRVGAELYGGELAFNKELLQEHTSAMKGGNMFGYFYQLMAVAGWTSYFWLPKLEMPTLVLAGEDDPIVPPVNGKILAKRLPNSTLVTIPCGHMFILTKPEVVAQAVRDFLQSDFIRETA